MAGEKMKRRISSSSSELSSPPPSPVDMITIAEAVPLNDFNERQSEHTDLLRGLNSLLGDELIAPTFWACSQLADKIATAFLNSCMWL